MAGGCKAIAGRVGSIGSARVGVGASGRGRGRESGSSQRCGSDQRGSASGAAALIEVEVRAGLGLGGIEGGRRADVGAVVGVEAEGVPGRTACGGEGRRRGGQAEVAEEDVHGLGCGEEGEDAHLGAAAGAEPREGLVEAGVPAPSGMRRLTHPQGCRQA